MTKIKEVVRKITGTKIKEVIKVEAVKEVKKDICTNCNNSGMTCKECRAGFAE